jgi:hypothetical protein
MIPLPRGRVNPARRTAGGALPRAATLRARRRLHAGGGPDVRRPALRAVARAHAMAWMRALNACSTARYQNSLNELRGPERQARRHLFPISTAYFNANGELWALDQVESAEINAADLPRELVPEHIGIEQGTLLYVYGADVFQQRYVADNQAVPSDEFWRLKRRGDVTPGPRVEARMVGRPAPLSIPDPKQVAKDIETARARWLLERPPSP